MPATAEHAHYTKLKHTHTCCGGCSFKAKQSTGFIARALSQSTCLNHTEWHYHSPTPRSLRPKRLRAKERGSATVVVVVVVVVVSVAMEAQGEVLQSEYCTSLQMQLASCITVVELSST